MHWLTILLPISLASGATVKWIPNMSFHLPINFKDGKLPCSRQTVVFPETIQTAVKMEGDMSYAGLILPLDGEIYFDTETISFGSVANETTCTETNVHYIQKASSSWNQPDVWSSEKFNKATPDAERVPCFDDTVEFPADMSFTCVLPEETQHVRQIKVGDETYDDFFDLIYNDYDETNFVMNSAGDYNIETGTKTCNSRSGCPCQEYPMKIDCSTKYCAIPTCVAPIKPIGHCCQICGGTLVFDVTEYFELMSFKELVDRTVSSYGGLIYHIGRLPNKVQLVVVEEKDYDGSSAEAVNMISYLMENHWVNNKKEALLSGSPLYKYGLGGKLFVSMFFVVVFVLGGVYWYYYHLNEVRYPVVGRWWDTGVLARFQRRSDSVVSLTRRDSEAPGFRNPMYDSRRGRVQVTESSLED